MLRLEQHEIPVRITKTFDLLYALWYYMMIQPNAFEKVEQYHH